MAKREEDTQRYSKGTPCRDGMKRWQNGKKRLAAILWCYDVTAESSFELQSRKLERHRMTFCRSGSRHVKLLEQLVKVQLLKTLPEDVCIFVQEGKPETSDDVCRLADNYVAAHKINLNMIAGRTRANHGKRSCRGEQH